MSVEFPGVVVADEGPGLCPETHWTGIPGSAGVEVLRGTGDPQCSRKMGIPSQDDSPLHAHLLWLVSL